jgi:hypothetical protein
MRELVLSNLLHTISANTFPSLYVTARAPCLYW